MEENFRGEIGVRIMMEECVKERRGRPEETGVEEAMDEDAKGSRRVRKIVVKAQQVEETETQLGIV